MLRRKIGTITLFLVLCLFLDKTLINAQANIRVFIEEPHELSFPTVEVNLRFLSADSRTINNIASNMIEVYENDVQISNFSLSSSSDGIPLRTVFIFDLGEFADFGGFDSELRRELRNFVSTSQAYFREGIDSVEILTITPQGNFNWSVNQSLAPSTSSVAIAQAFDSIILDNFSGNTDAFDALRRTIDTTIARPDYIPGDTSIILVTRFINNNLYRESEAITNANLLAQDASANHIPIHVWQTDQAGLLSDPLMALTNGTGGIYTNVNVLLRNGNVNNGTISLTYNQIAQQRINYLLSYETRVFDGSPISLEVRVPGSGLSASTNFSFQMSSPDIRLIEPAANSRFQRTRNLDEIFDREDVGIIASVQWPEVNLDTRISKIELMLNGVAIQDITLERTANQLDFLWDISGIVLEGEQTYQLSLRLTDIYGLQFESNVVNTTVAVVYQRPPVETEPTIINICDTEEGRLGCALQLIVPSSISILALSVAGYFFYHYSKLKEGSVGERLSKTFHDVTEPFRAKIAGKGKLAELVVDGGVLDLRGNKYTIMPGANKIGRDNSWATILTPPTARSISRQHCVIYYDGLKNEFRVVPEADSSGTVLNGQLLTPENSYTLKSGDKLALGNVSEYTGLSFVLHDLRDITEADRVSAKAPVDKTETDSDRAASSVYQAAQQFERHHGQDDHGIMADFVNSRTSEETDPQIPIPTAEDLRNAFRESQEAPKNHAPKSQENNHQNEDEDDGESLEDFLRKNT